MAINSVVFKRYGCTDPVTRTRLDRACPRLAQSSQGSWYFACSTMDVFGSATAATRRGRLRCGRGTSFWPRARRSARRAGAGRSAGHRTDEAAAIVFDRRLAQANTRGLPIGTAQILALLPAIRRSDATVGAGLTEEDAARFAFLVACLWRRRS